MLEPSQLARIVSVFDLDEEKLTRLFETVWDPAKHPRHPAGTVEGGEFAPKDEAFTRADAERFDDQTYALTKTLNEEAVLYLDGDQLPLDAASRAKVKAKIAESLGKVLAKDPAAQELVEMAGGQLGLDNPHNISDPYQRLAAQFVDRWAATSGDANPAAIAMQHAIHEEFGIKGRVNHLPMTQDQALERTVNGWQRGLFVGKDGVGAENVPRAKELMNRTMRTFARNMYAQTQADLKARGIHEVYLYRGVKMGLGHRYAGTLAAFRRTELQPASSFSTSRHTSENFGSTMMLVKVPRSRVLSTWRTGFGCKGEDEVVLIGGRVQTLWGTQKNIRNHSKTALWDAAVSHSKPKTPSKKVKQPELQPEHQTETTFAAEDEARNMLTPDADLYNADWPKRTWDGLGSRSEWLRNDPLAAALVRARGYEEDNGALFYNADLPAIEKRLNALEEEALGEIVGAISAARDNLIGHVKENFKANETSAKWVADLSIRGWEAVRTALREMASASFSSGRMDFRAEVNGQKDHAVSVTPREAARFMDERMFWVSGVMRDDLTKRAQTILMMAIKTGEDLLDTVDKLAEAFTPYVGKKGVDEAVVTPSRLETIVRTNTSEAYNQGRLASIHDPEMAPFIIGIRYSAILDERTTEICQYLHGKVFKPDEPEIDRIAPPNHFNCRSLILPVIIGEEIDSFANKREINKGLGMIRSGFGGDAEFSEEERTVFGPACCLHPSERPKGGKSK